MSQTPRAERVTLEAVEHAFERGDVERAAKLIHRLPAAVKRSPHGRAAQARVRAWNGELERAAEELERAVRDAPEAWDLRAHLGGLYALLERDDEARRLLKDAARHGCSTAGVHHAYALVTLRKGDLDKALRHAREACEKAGAPESRALLGEILYARKDLRAAAKVLLPLADDYPSLQEAVALAARCAVELGDVPTALRLLEQAMGYLDEGDDAPELRLTYARLREEARRDLPPLGRAP